MLILTCHVTYWDRFGWKDNFAKSAFDQRQWEYATALRRKNDFTPQVIVNGQVDGVGHNSRDLQVLITKGNAFSTAQTMEILYMIHGGGITVSGLGNEHGVVSVIRYDDRDHDGSITHGENNGRKLRHTHIVKDVTHVGSWSGGFQSYALPPLQRGGEKVAVLVHAGAGGPINGAARIKEAGGLDLREDTL